MTGLSYTQRRFFSWGCFQKNVKHTVIPSTANNSQQKLYLEMPYLVKKKTYFITGVPDVGMCDPQSILTEFPQWKVLTEGKTMEDARKGKEGFGQLLLAMFAVLIRFEAHCGELPCLQRSTPS